MHKLAGKVRDRALARECKAVLDPLKKAFVDRFWLAGGTLADVVHKDGSVDDAVRPNMVIAAALATSPLKKAQRLAIVQRAEADLLTPRGLRTLAPSHRDYVGRYRGGPRERDRAYHQGTVWPWLLGFHTEASLRANRVTAALVARLRGLWDGLAAELDEAGLNHLSEVFDGDPPHVPGGTIAQAWNTGEWLRAHALLDAAR